MNTSMLTKPRVCNVFNGNQKDIRGLKIPEATLADTRDARHNESLKISDVCLVGVSFRSSDALIPGKVHYLTAKGADSTSLVSALRIVSCRLRADGDFDVSAEFF